MSRRLRAGIAALCVAAAVLLVRLDHSSQGQRQPQGRSQEQARAGDVARYHGKTFTVVNVVDGDTIDVDVPDGEYEHTRIRLWGVDTPETKSPKVGVMYFGSLRRSLWVRRFVSISTRGIERGATTAGSWDMFNWRTTGS